MVKYSETIKWCAQNSRRTLCIQDLKKLQNFVLWEYLQSHADNVFWDKTTSAEQINNFDIDEILLERTLMKYEQRYYHLFMPVH